jgi:hypothetical protein
VKQAKKRAPMEILRPGQRNEFWETVLSIRDNGDPRWLGTFSHGFRLTAEAYEKVRDAVEDEVRQAA